MRSVESSFSFVNYKIDKAELWTDGTLGFLRRTDPFAPDEVELSVGLRNPGHLPNTNGYVSGLDAMLEITDAGTGRTSFRVKMGISGLFEISDVSDLDDPTVERVVKYQFPALLLPYLRGALTSFLANAGFPGVFLPLININKMAQQSGLSIVELHQEADS